MSNPFTRMWRTTPADLLDSTPVGDTVNPRNPPPVHDSITTGDGGILGPGDSSLGRVVRVFDFSMASMIVNLTPVIGNVNTNTYPPPLPLIEEKQEPVKLRPRYEIL